MQEWVLVLKMMTADHHKWPMPPVPPPISASAAVKGATELSEAERRELRRAVHKIVREANGELSYDEGSGFYVPARQVPDSAEVK